MSEHNLVEAVNLALHRAMTDDAGVLVLGEDTGIYGGVFRATDGLYQAFGAQRVFDTPLAETVIAGLAVGLAAQGFRPVAEVQFMGFIYPMIDQLVNHAARLRNRTRGRLSCPMVLRAAYGGGIGAPEHHSESTEAMLTHIPGLRVVVPSTPARAYGLLLAAIQDPDPVVFLEPKKLYRSTSESFSDDGKPLPLDRAFVQRQGTDLTLIAWGSMLTPTLDAAGELATEGIQAEVIDVATLKPLDEETILRSVAKTGRAVIVHEAAITGGYGAEIAASITTTDFFELESPVIRVAGYDTVVPMAKLEYAYLPDTRRIVSAARRALAE